MMRIDGTVLNSNQGNGQLFRKFFPSEALSQALETDRLTGNAGNDHFV